MTSLDPPIGPYDHLEGVLGAPHSLVEYGDFECPYCRAAVPVGPTFPSWSPVAQLDHVLVRGRLVMAELQVGSAGPSDHLSLTATVYPPD